ncbi:hypothetical protein WCLP8_230007 [uncultured Gammaproteobacteria bacterium]
MPTLRISGRGCRRLSALAPALVAAAMLVALLMPRVVLASGGQAEARAVALTANCAATKIEIMRQTPGQGGETVYKVSCSDFKEMFLLIQCRQRQCVVLR